MKGFMQELSWWPLLWGWAVTLRGSGSLGESRSSGPRHPVRRNESTRECCHHCPLRASHTPGVCDPSCLGPSLQSKRTRNSTSTAVPGSSQEALQPHSGWECGSTYGPGTWISFNCVSLESASSSSSVWDALPSVQSESWSVPWQLQGAPGGELGVQDGSHGPRASCPCSGAPALRGRALEVVAPSTPGEGHGNRPGAVLAAQEPSNPLGMRVQLPAWSVLPGCPGPCPLAVPVPCRCWHRATLGSPRVPGSPGCHHKVPAQRAEDAGKENLLLSRASRLCHPRPALPLVPGCCWQGIRLVPRAAAGVWHCAVPINTGVTVPCLRARA